MSSSAEDKAEDKLRSIRELLAVWAAGSLNWQFSGLTGMYDSFDEWVAVATSKDSAFAAIVAAGAKTYEAIRKALVAHYRSLEPPPPPPPPTEGPSPGIPWGQVGRDTELVLKAVAGVDEKLRMMAKAMGILLTLFLFIGVAQAQTVTFQWDPHEEAAQITGFKLYQASQSGVYGASVATFTPGTLTTGQIPQPGLGRHYFVLTAFVDTPTGALESDVSNEVTLVLKPKPPKLISVIQTIALAPIRGIQQLAGLFREEKGLRVR